MAKKRKAYGSCTWVPQIQSEPSELYVGLIDMHVERPLANLIYAKYLTSNTKSRMDSAGYKRNQQGQHSAKDVFKFFNVAAIQNAQGYSLGRMEKKYGVVENNGSRKLFTSEEAFAKAQEINSADNGFVAQVIQRGDKFTVIIDPEDSRTHYYKAQVDGQMTLWNELSDIFNNMGIDLQAISNDIQDFVNPLRTLEFLASLKTISRVRDVSRLNEREIKLILHTAKGSPLINNLLNRGWGDLADTASEAYEVLQNPSNYAPDVVNFVKSALNEGKTYNAAAFENARTHLQAVKTQYYKPENNPNVAVETVLRTLDEKYGINSKVINRVGKDIERLSDAAAEAIVILGRQLRKYQRQEGRTAQVVELEGIIESVTNELEGKRYVAGLLSFLQKAQRYATTIDSMLRTIPTTGTALEYSMRAGSILSKAKSMQEGYQVLLSALMFADKLIIDENVNDEDLNNLKEQARAVNEIISGYDNEIKLLSRDVMLTMSQEIIGDTASNGISIAQLVKSAERDSSLFDYLYSCERVSDPILGVMGTVIRDAQLKRDRELIKIGREIDDLTHNLIKSKHNSRFIYEPVTKHRVDWKGYYKELANERKRLRKEGYSGDELIRQVDAWIDANTELVGHKRIPNSSWVREDTVYHIASKYDWEAFYDAESKEKRSLHEQNITGSRFTDAMEVFKRDNMVEEPVDWDERGNVTRTEWVPNSSYWKTEDFQKDWDSAQKEYYEKMMKLKGRLGSLLPEYAQKQFLPPQLRASWMEIVSEAKLRGLNAKGVALRILDRMNKFKEQPDDTQFLSGAVPSEGGVSMSRSDYDDSILRDIPLYYVNPLREQSDLVFNFSAAMRAFASTAVNYNAMNEIKDLVEQMGDYLKYRRRVGEVDENGKNKFDLFRWGNTVISKAILKKKGHTVTSGLVDGFISKHLYNEQLAKGNEGGMLRRGQLLMKALLEYTSINQLAVNLKGAVSNWLVGEYQMLIEAVAGSMGKAAKAISGKDSSDILYSLGSFFKAHAVLFGRGLEKGQIMDHFSNDVNGLGHLLEERFDPLQEVYADFGGKRYLTGWKKLFGGFNIMGFYSAGESLIHLTNMYAVLLDKKVRLNGKKVSLYSVLTKESTGNGNSRLIVKPGATTLDYHPIDEAFLNSVADDIRYINQKTHGSMNSEDKGLIHRYMAGRAVMNFRQWMVEHYSRRYRGRYFDGTTRTWQEGYYNTVYKMFASYISEFLKLSIDSNAKWDQLDNVQKDNVRRAFAEIAMFFGLLGISTAVGDPKDHKGEWGYRFLIYQIRRLIMDEEASIPPIPFLTGGFVEEGTTLLNSPVAAVKTINGILYPITGLEDLGEEYEKGRNKGKSKYWTKVKKNTLPFVNQIDQTIHMADEDYIFNVFDNIKWNKSR